MVRRVPSFVTANDTQLPHDMFVTCFPARAGMSVGSFLSSQSFPSPNLPYSLRPRT